MGKGKEAWKRTKWWLESETCGMRDAVVGGRREMVLARSSGGITDERRKMGTVASAMNSDKKVSRT